MKFGIDKNKAIRILELITLTQSDEQDMWDNSSAVEEAENLLKMLLAIPEDCVMIMLTEEEYEIIKDYEGM